MEKWLKFRDQFIFYLSGEFMEELDRTLKVN